MSTQGRERMSHYSGRQPEPASSSADQARPRLRDQDAPSPVKVDRKESLYSQESAMWSHIAVAGFPMNESSKSTHDRRPKTDNSRAPPPQRRATSDGHPTRSGSNNVPRSKSSTASSVKRVRFALPITEEAENENADAIQGKSSSRPQQQRSQTAPSRIESASDYAERVNPTMSLRDWIYQPVVSPTSSVVSNIEPTATSHSIPGSQAPLSAVGDMYGSTRSSMTTSNDRKPAADASAWRSDMEAALLRAASGKEYNRAQSTNSKIMPLLDVHPRVYGWPGRRDDLSWRMPMDTPDAMHLQLNGKSGMSDRRRSAV